MDNFKFMDSWPAWVRWLLVAPAIVLVSWFFWLISDVAANAPLWFYLVMATIYSAVLVWCAAATAPRFKLLLALALGLVLIAAVLPLGPTVGLWSVHFWDWSGPYVAGVIIAWGLVAWARMRRRRAGLPSR